MLRFKDRQASAVHASPKSPDAPELRLSNRMKANARKLANTAYSLRSKSHGFLSPMPPAAVPISALTRTLSVALFLMSPAHAAAKIEMTNRQLLETVLSNQIEKIPNDADTRKRAFSAWAGAFAPSSSSECAASAAEYVLASEYFFQFYREQTGESAAGALEFEILHNLRNAAKGQFGSSTNSLAKEPDLAAGREGGAFVHSVLGGCGDPRTATLHENFMRLFSERARSPITGGRYEQLQKQQAEVARQANAERERRDLSLADARARGVDVDAIKPLVMVQPLFAQHVGTSSTPETVRVGYSITTEGQTSNLRVIEGDPKLGRVALRAMSRWKFRPIIIDGEAYSINGLERAFSTMGEAEAGHADVP
jgi:hypothetical protein